MNDNGKHNNNDQIEPNEAFSRDMKSLFGTDCNIPAGIDNAILSCGRMNMPGKPKRRFIRYAGIASAAAIVFIAIMLNISPNSSTDIFAIEDINRSGTVDILDAFTLARAVETNSNLDDSWDINGDGKIDASDVDTIAMAAVTINKGAI